MRALLDVNVLIALLDASHSSHRNAIAWFTDHGRSGWASCPLTQNGCIRVMSNPSYSNSQPVHVVTQRLAEACASKYHEFWAADISWLDEHRIDATRAHGAKQLTDIYLLALAVKFKGRLVTFDQGISIAAAKGATAQHLLRI
jgi:uncharacterized protein